VDNCLPITLSTLVLEIRSTSADKVDSTPVARLISFCIAVAFADSAAVALAISLDKSLVNFCSAPYALVYSAVTVVSVYDLACLIALAIEPVVDSLPLIIVSLSSFTFTLLVSEDTLLLIVVSA
jgi:hypothetical protein